MISLTLVILLLFNLCYREVNHSPLFKESSFLNRNYNSGFRGGLAILIVFHHISKYYDGYLIKEGGAYGMVVVGLFFFFSGYGLMKQRIAKGNKYLKGFLFKKSLKLLPSFFILLCIMLIISPLTDINLFEIGNRLIGNILIPNSWFVYVLFYYYIAFAIIGKYFSNANSITIAMFFATILLIIFCIVVGLGDWWWKSSLAFNMGLLVPLLDDKINSHKKNLFYILFCLLISCTFINIMHLGFHKMRFILLLLFTTFLPIFLYIAFQYVMYPKSKIMDFLGSISYEIYLTHGVILSLVLYYIPNISAISCFVTVMLLTVIASYFIKSLSSIVANKIKEITNA